VFSPRKIKRATRISENTLSCGRASQETSWIPIRPQHVHGSLPNPRCHRLFESYSVPQEKLSHARTRLRQVLSRTRSRSASTICKKSNGSDLWVRAAPISASLARKDLEGRLIFEGVRALSVLYLIYFAMLCGELAKHIINIFIFSCVIFFLVFFKI